MHHQQPGFFHVGNLGFGAQQRQLPQLAFADLELHAGAVKHQIALQLRQGWPGGLTRRLQTCGHIGKPAIAQGGGDAELAFARVGEGHVVQVAAHLELNTASAALHHCVTHIVAHRGVQHQGQVAVHPGGVGPGQLALQVQHPRKTGTAGRLRRLGGLPLGL